MSDLDLESLTVVQLKALLKKVGQPTTGNKAELLQLAKLNYDHDVALSLDHSSQLHKSLQEARKVFDDKDLAWEDVMVSKAKIPRAFTAATINRFLTVTELEADDEVLDVGTGKPSIRGRKLCSAYKSSSL